eukprot:CAMPEP_0170382974 /NCGR_PEP_ID=MMETSP0117_2-20130122/15232_1 /TAXON_ID=400756 /ORGANISM="Durinskia baltica, Strain CSIRO CS-38" /LENGTH=56 /DNA_ID=CAMNT_0010638655 /DNA_START=490 /DNA_END=660 /DNA_ORIENTATION=-
MSSWGKEKQRFLEWILSEEEKSKPNPKFNASREELNPVISLRLEQEEVDEKNPEEI